MKRIVVIGATGMIGIPVTRELIKAGFDVTLAVRNIKKASRIFPLAKTVSADVFDIASLLNAFRNKDIVYISLDDPHSARASGPLAEKEGIANIISAARQTGILRLGLLSSIIMRYNGMNGFRWWRLSIKSAAVTQIQNSGIPYSVFYASTFMETLDQRMMRGNRIVLAGHSRFPIWFIAAEDFGIQVAWSFQKTTGENKEYIIQGPEAFTWQEAASEYVRHYTASRISVTRIPLKLLDIISSLSSQAGYVQRIMTALNNYPEVQESAGTWEELGKPRITLAEYAAQKSKLVRSGVQPGRK